MCMNVSPECMHVHRVWAWCPQRSETGSDPLELGLQIVVSHMWVVGMESLSCLPKNQRGMSPAPTFVYLFAGGGGYMFCSVHMEVGSHPLGVSSHLPSCSAMLCAPGWLAHKLLDDSPCLPSILPRSAGIIDACHCCRFWCGLWGLNPGHQGCMCCAFTNAWAISSA